MRILLVEDDRDLARSMKIILRKKGFVVDHADSAHTAFDYIKCSHYTLLLLDIGLPDNQAHLVCKSIRSANKNIPIIIVTARNDSNTKTQFFQMQIDDYMTKPFTNAELLVRINTVLGRKNKNQKEQFLRIADLEVDTEKRIVKRAGKIIPLRNKEYQLLVYLLKHTGKVISRYTLLEQVWQNHLSSVKTTVDVHIAWLRQKIDVGYKQKLIHTIYGAGYKLDIEDNVR